MNNLLIYLKLYKKLYNYINIIELDFFNIIFIFIRLPTNLIKKIEYKSC